MAFFLGPMSVQRCRVLIRLEHWEEEDDEEEALGLMSNEDEEKRKEKKEGRILSF
jgi:hypothetical protein